MANGATSFPPRLHPQAPATRSPVRGLGDEGFAGSEQQPGTGHVRREGALQPR